MTAILSSTGVASCATAESVTELDSAVPAVAVEMICPGEFDSGAEGPVKVLGWYRYLSGTIGIGGVAGTVSKRLNESLDELKEGVERIGGGGGSACSDEADVVVINDGAEAVDSV
jgi:hypothetical protein